MDVDEGVPRVVVHVERVTNVKIRIRRNDVLSTTGGLVTNIFLLSLNWRILT